MKFSKSFIDHNVKFESTPPNHQIQSHRHIKQIALAIPVEPHCSNVALITHVFEKCRTVSSILI